MRNKLFVLRIAAVALLGFSWSSYAQSNKFVVTLDAGHGGKDFGAVYDGRVEKNIVLDVTLKVGELLDKNKNIKVVYTRKTDVYIELLERANIANRNDSHLFISIHCNANKNTAADGNETYIMGMNKNESNLEAAKRENSVILLEKDYKEKYAGFDPKSPGSMIGIELMQEEFIENSINLASKIQDNFLKNMKRRNRGVKQAPFFVLHKAYMPRVLVEMGFISNPKEGDYLMTEAGKNAVAKSIADAVNEYYKDWAGGKVDEGERPSTRFEEAPTASVTETRTETPKAIEEVKSAPAKTEKPAETATKGIVFRVQISASSRKIEANSPDFKGLSPITRTSDDGSLYRYFFGETTKYEEAKKLAEQAKANGFASAYVVPFKDGKRISIQEALK